MCFYFISINILIPKLFYFILYYFLILYCLYIRLAGLHKLLLAISCADTIYPLDMRGQYPTYSSQLPYLDRLANTRKKATETHRLLYKVYRRPFQANCTRWLLLLLCDSRGISRTNSRSMLAKASFSLLNFAPFTSYVVCRRSQFLLLFLLPLYPF